MKDLLHTVSQNVSQTPVQGRPCTYPRGYTELFQVSLIGFQKFFFFWVAGIILEGWKVELERVHSFGI